MKEYFVHVQKHLICAKPSANSIALSVHGRDNFYKIYPLKTLFNVYFNTTNI